MEGKKKQTNKWKQTDFGDLAHSVFFLGFLHSLTDSKVSSHRAPQTAELRRRTLLPLIWVEGSVCLCFFQMLWFTHYLSFINFILLTIPHSHLQGDIVLFPVFQGEEIFDWKRLTDFPGVTQGFVNRIKIRPQLMSLSITSLIFLPPSIQRGSQ